MSSYKVVSKPFLNADKIFPTQQRDVYKLLRYFSSFDSIKKITVFGSSVKCTCNPWSDIDIYIESDSNENFHRYGSADIENPVDLWTNFTVDKDLPEEINSKGVVVYER